MKYVVAVLTVTVFFGLPAFAQKGPCTEDAVRGPEVKTQEEPPKINDFYFFTNIFEKPVIGEAERREAIEAMPHRSNIKRSPIKWDRLVVAPSGDMAYEYGTHHLSWDQDGKHYDFTSAILAVWKADHGACKMAAWMAEREGSPRLPLR
jgi:ketosteroid isomerase-like protein